MRVDRIALGIGLSALALVAGALGLQYLGGVAPCEMCHWQRWLHLAAALTGLVLIPLEKNLRLAAITLAAICGLIAAYYLGMLASWQPLLLAATIIALLAVGAWNPRLLALTALALVLVSGLMGLYQTGMQYHLVPGPSACTGQRFVIGSNMIPVVQCDVPTWFLFGLALPAYNAIFSFLIAGLGGLALWKTKHAA